MNQSWFHVIAALVAVCTIASAQEDVLRPNGRPGATPKKRSHSSGTGAIWRLGLEAGINVNSSSRDVTGASQSSIYNTFASASGISPLFGVYVEAELSSVIALGARFLYDMKNVSGSKTDAFRDCSILDPYTGTTIVSAPISASFENSLSYITINPVVRVTLADRLFLHAGPVIQFAASQLESSLTQSVSESEQCRFVDADGNFTLTSITSTGSEDANPSTRFGLDAGIGYRIAITPKIDLVPRLGYQFMFTEYASGANVLDDTQAQTNPPARNVSISTGSLNSLQASLSLWFSL